MTFDTPAWTAFDDGALPGLPDLEESKGRVVALLTVKGAEAGGWATEVAAGLVRSWVGRGLRVVLADAGIHSPTLHDEFGVKNQEGLTDALLWGASVQHVARPLAEEGFYLITAGTAVPQGADALRNDRWNQLCSGFQEAGVSLIVLVPEGSPDSEAILATATDVVILASPHDDVHDLLGGRAQKVRAIVGREATVRGEDGDGAEQEAESGVAAPVVDGPVEDDPVDDSVADAVADTVPVPADEPVADLVDEVRAPLEGVDDWARGIRERLRKRTAVGPIPSPTSRPRAGRRPDRVDPPPKNEALLRKSDGLEHKNIIIAVIVVALLAVVLAAWIGLLPGFGGGDAPSEDAAVALEAEPLQEPVAASRTAATGPSESSPLMGYSLAMGAYQDAGVANRRVAALARGVPGVVFASVPVEVNGSVFYRVLAGPAADSAEASRLAELVSRAANLDPSTWVIRPTPRAFRVGEMDDLEAAERRVVVLSELGLPAYVLAVDYSDGSTRYRVYTGAYGDEAEASHLYAMLAERGLGAAALSDRIGRRPE